MGAKLSSCQNAVMPLSFPINHEKKIHLLIFPSGASSPSLTYPRIRDTYLFQWAQSCFEVLNGKVSGGQDPSTQGPQLSEF